MQKLRDAGKMTVTERVDALLDPDSFQELGLFVKHQCHDFGMDKKEMAADGVVTGIGTIEITLTERIWNTVLDLVREIAECFNIEDENILDMLVNRSDKLNHFVEIYQLKLAS